MKFLYFGDLHPLSKLLFLTFIVLFGFLLFLVLSLIISVPLFGIDLTNWKDYMTLETAANIPFMKFSQAMQSTGMFILPSLLAALLFTQGKNRIGNYLKARTPLNPELIGYILIIAVLALPIASLIGKLNASVALPENLAQMEKSAQILTERFLISNSYTALFVNLIVIALIPAIGEEFLFRGTVQRIFTEWFKNEHFAILAASLLFSFIHFQFLGFIPRVLLGMLFGYIFVYTRNIWYSVLAHFLNNAVGVILYFIIAGNPDTSFAEEIKGTTTDFTSAEAVIALISAALLYLLMKKIKQTVYKNTTSRQSS